MKDYITLNPMNPEDIEHFEKRYLSETLMLNDDKKDDKDNTKEDEDKEFHESVNINRLSEPEDEIVKLLKHNKIDFD